MSRLFLGDDEKAAIRGAMRDPAFANLYWGLMNRAQAHARSPGLRGEATTTDWWHHVFEYVSETALACALKPDDALRAWVRGTTLDLARRSVDDWVGPFFRNHVRQPPVGNLETAHLSMAVAVALDLVPDIFTGEEREELTQALREKGIALCRRWIERNRNLANWRCILLAGVAVAAAVVDDAETMQWAADEYRRCLDVVQPDGSYAESLQYASYGYFGLMMTREALVRRRPDGAADLSVEPYAKAVDWFAHSLFYRKPVADSAGYPVPRSANFNDSAAVAGPMPDLLMHIAACAPEAMAREASLARWLFDRLYVDYPGQGPFDQSSFGFVNRCGILTVLYYPRAPEALAPEAAGLPRVRRFTNGHCVARTDWDERGTVLAFSGASDPLHAPGHLHADLNSFILVHNRERLLLDPGHSCYRNLIHGLEAATQSHNTCTFMETADTDLQESVHQARHLEQGMCARRGIDDAGVAAPPVDRPGKALLCAGIDDVFVIGSDAGPAYGAPIRAFRRFCLLAGEHVLFVVDEIEADRPVRPVWNWLLNNRDGQLDLKVLPPDRIVARRGNAGMKLFHLGGAAVSGPFYGFVHDSYHPLPGQPGEGRSGSGLHLRWTGAATTAVRGVHAIAVDRYGPVAGWHLKTGDDGAAVLESPGGTSSWALHVEEGRMRLCETVSGRGYIVEQSESKVWRLGRTV